MSDLVGNPEDRFSRVEAPSLMMERNGNFLLSLMNNVASNGLPLFSVPSIRKTDRC